MGYWDYDDYDDYDDPYDYDSSYYDDPYDLDDADKDITNSGDINSEESTMPQVGQQFSTGNATVRNLKAGTILEVVGPGQLEIVELPEVVFNTGDRIYTKHGASTVVRLSSRFGSLDGFNPETQVLYVADGSAAVRRANKSDVSAI